MIDKFGDTFLANLVSLNNSAMSYAAITKHIAFIDTNSIPENI